MNPDEFVLLNQSGPIITFSGSFPANPYEGQMGIVGGIMYRYQYVAELNGDTLTLSDYTVNTATDSLSIKFNFRDVAAGIGATTRTIYSGRTSGNSQRLRVDIKATTGYIRAVAVNSDLASGYLTSEVPINVCDGKWHDVELKFTSLSTTARLWCVVDGISSTDVNISAWDTTQLSKIIFNDATDVMPLDVCCIRQIVNSVVVDGIKCNESTGITLANAVTPSRPATLSDGTAHALVPVPISIL